MCVWSLVNHMLWGPNVPTMIVITVIFDVLCRRYSVCVCMCVCVSVFVLGMGEAEL